MLKMLRMLKCNGNVWSAQINPFFWIKVPDNVCEPSLKLSDKKIVKHLLIINNLAHVPRLSLMFPVQNTAERDSECDHPDKTTRQKL